MGLINKLYVFVQDEDVQRGVEVSQHPVEKGLDITDNVKRSPVVIKIKGEIVGKKAKDTLKKITKLHQKGSYVKYTGKNVLKKAIITSFNTSHPNTIWGGCSFDMEITEIRIAKSPVKTTKKGKKTKGGTKQVKKKSKKKTKNRMYKVKKGDTLWSIAKSYYGSGSKYSKIYNANKKAIGKNPHHVKAGIKLKIPS